MSAVASALRDARARLNLTQAQAAQLLATQQANISAYEHGRLEPGRVVTARINAFAQLEQNSVYTEYLASTMPSAAAQIRTDLAAGRSDTDMLRVVIQASDDFARLTTPSDYAFFLTEPSPTGSQQWDALLAGLAVHLCRQANVPSAPFWTTDPARQIDHIWWFGRADAVPQLRAHALQDAVPSMRARGVIFSRANLESV
jgi:transcriptional regulator with XRE-family HTH domain